MILPSIHNLLAKLDSTFTKDSQETNFYQLLQMVSHEIDAARRELSATKNDNYYTHVRDDQLFANLGVLLKINKQPFFTKRHTDRVGIKALIEEDFASRPKCLTERLAKVTVEWTTELDTTSQVEYSQNSPFIIPGSIDPTTTLFDPVNASILHTASGNRGKKHKVVIAALKFSTELFLRIKSVDLTGETRQSEFVQISIPATIVTPILKTFTPPFQDGAGNTIQTPNDSDPFGFRFYRKVLYAVLSSYLQGPTLKGVATGIQPFFDLPVEIVENFPAIPDLYSTNAIPVEYETFLHTFFVSIILNNDPEKLRDLGELNEQVQEVLNFIKPAHVLTKFQYVVPDHFFCPTDNPFGTKQKSISLEPTMGPCGEKAYINPSAVDLGASAYYQDNYGYRLYCDYAINYFDNFCYQPNYGYEFHQGYNVTSTLNGYYDVLDRNYFYIQNGQRLVICPFVKNQDAVLVLEHKNGDDPESILIEGDVEETDFTFREIPFVKKIQIRLTKGNGAKTVYVSFNYPEQMRTNTGTRRLNETVLATGCHGTVKIEAVTFLLNTIPSECCAEEYIEDVVTMESDVFEFSEDVFLQSNSFVLNSEESVLNGPLTLGHMTDESDNGFGLDAGLFTNLESRVLNDPDVVLSPDPVIKVTEMEMDTYVREDLCECGLITNGDESGCYEGLLNETPLNAGREVLYDGLVTGEIYDADHGFILNGDEQYNDSSIRHYQYRDPDRKLSDERGAGKIVYFRIDNDPSYFTISRLNDPNVFVSPIDRIDVEPWRHKTVDLSCVASDEYRDYISPPRELHSGE